MSSFMEIWDDEVEKVNAALSSYLDWKIDRVSKLGEWHVQFYENMKEYLMRGGKRLRPVLVVVGYKAVKPEIEIEHLYRAGCSIEALHNGSLLHDDLIDHDETRRGGKTFHAKYRDMYKEKRSDSNKAKDYGMTMAILGGDALINMGSMFISDSNLPAEVTAECLKLYQTSYENLADGVMLEMTMIDQPDTTPEIYLEMIALKTAVLFDNSLSMGATIAGATESQISALSEFGVKVGQAFQIQDDILGSFGDESVTGKSTDGDIREGKKTMLVLKAYQLATAEQRSILDSLLGNSNMTSDEVTKVREIFSESGALAETKNLMEQLLSEGQSALDRAEPALTPKYKEFLIALSEFLTKRNY
ncbi:MAG: polyprenyl synthetase family protein [Candidatus Thorarchaeota archaeon]|nr:polyprenyl synthetase family protein [Candidatus Thorarchaeota archaeon]